jgi:hypothetical protein
MDNSECEPDILQCKYNIYNVIVIYIVQCFRFLTLVIIFVMSINMYVPFNANKIYAILCLYSRKFFFIETDSSFRGYSFMKKEYSNGRVY